MFPQSHFLFTLLISEILVKLGYFSHTIAILTALIALLIDFDHFVYYSIKHKDFNLKHAWNAAVSGHEKERTFIHHLSGVLLIIIIILIVFFINPFISSIIFIAYYSHILLDYTHLNILKIKGKYKEKLEGFTIKISKSEVCFDIILLIGIILLGTL